MAFTAQVRPKINPLLQASLPRQAIARSAKGPMWRRSNVDAIHNMGNIVVHNGRTSKQRKQTNYNLVNSITDPGDTKYVTDPYNVGAKLGNQPAKLRDFNLIANKVNLIKGEEMDSVFDFQAIGVNGEVIPVIADERKNVILEATQELLRSELSSLNGGDRQASPPELKQVVNNFNKTYRDIREQNANHVLNYLTYKEKLRYKFNEGFEHGLISSEEVYYVGIGSNGNPSVRAVNTLNFDYDKNPDLNSIEDGDWAKEERWLSAGAIIDLYGEYLTDKDIKDIETGDIGTGLSTSNYYPGFLYTPVELRNSLVNSSAHRGSSGNSHILVVNVCWKSRKKIGFVTEISPDGEVIETIVDEAFSLSDIQKENGVVVEWRWINEVWQGTRIGSSLYVNIEPIPNQIRSMDDPSECKLPYVGGSYNNLNSSATSLVELMKPHQYLYNIVWYRLENELAKAKGKAFIMDLAQIPKSQGMNLTEWMYYFETAGIAFINSMEEGKGTLEGQKSAFNQFKDIDRSLSQVVGQYIMVLNKIEELLDTITGISPQRAAQVGKNETATGVRSSINQSSAITAPLFQRHYMIVEQVLTQLLETAKVAYADGKKLSYVIDEIYRVSVDIDGEIFNDSDYGVFITNAIRNKVIRQKIEGLAETAVQANVAELNDLIRIYKSSSTSEMEGILEESMANKHQKALELIEKQNEAIIAKNQQDNDLSIEKEDREDAREQLQADTDITVARIKALSSLGAVDTNNNNVLDVLEIGKQEIEKMKISSAERLKQLELAQKDRSDKSKEKIARNHKHTN